MMAQVRKSRKIRMKPSGSDSELSFLTQEGTLTREEAIHRIRHFLLESCHHPTAQRLIGLFSIAPEELAEAGLPYEDLKVLERLALFI
jgi:hypothetical protein